MSWMPDLEIGVWNAWIFMVVLFVAAFAPLAIKGEVVEKRTAGEPSGDERRKTTRIVTIITHVILMPFTMIIRIFVPIKLGAWWFYSGLLV